MTYSHLKVLNNFAKYLRTYSKERIQKKRQTVLTTAIGNQANKIWNQRAYMQSVKIYKTYGN